MKRVFSKLISTSLAAVMTVSCIPSANVSKSSVFSPLAVNVEAASSINITESSGQQESAYVEWSDVSGAKLYKVFADGTQIDNELIRRYPGYWRADAVGLKAGSHKLKVVAYSDTAGTSEIASAETGSLNVVAYDRSGAAFSSKSVYKTGSGAYNDDGTLRSTAQVIYVTSKNAKTVTAKIIDNSKGTETTYTGLQNIIYGLQKGYDTRGLDIRIIGTIDADDVDSFGSSAEGIQVKGKAANSEMNLTIEGIGEDATVRGFGFLVRNSGNVEFRNFAIMLCLDDSLSLDTNNTNIWLHDMDFFYGGTGGDADQAKGDGTTDIKGNSTAVTVSYNHYFDNGKSSLCGMKSEKTSSHITYHHNWFDHSDSRHPRIRTMSVHIYNNYFDNNSKYGVGVTMGSSAFVESNYFENCNDVMMSSGQGTDAQGDGTFSGETGGIIKSYNNEMVGTCKYIPYSQNSTSFDAVEVDARTAKLSSSIKTVSGGTSYNNFDTDTSNFDLAVKSITPVADVPSVVKTYAGRVNGGDFPVNRSSYEGLTSTLSHAVDTALKSDMASYKSSLISVGGTSDGSVITTQKTETTTQATTKKVETTTEATTKNTETTTKKTETTTEATTSAPVDGAAVMGTYTFGKKATGSLAVTEKAATVGNISFKLHDIQDATAKLRNTTVSTFKLSGSTKVEIAVSSGAGVVISNGSNSYTFTSSASSATLPAGTYTLAGADGSNTVATSMTLTAVGSTNTTKATTTTTEATTEATTKEATTTTVKAAETTTAAAESVALTPANVNSNNSFTTSVSKGKIDSSKIQLNAGDSISFKVSKGATVKVTAKHASSTDTKDRYLYLKNGSSVVSTLTYKKGAAAAEQTMATDLAAGTYTITASSSINITSVVVVNAAAVTAVKGDANADGTVDTNDVNHILSYVVGEISSVNDADAADVNGDGKVTSKDASKIQKYLKGKISSL